VRLVTFIFLVTLEVVNPRVMHLFVFVIFVKLKTLLMDSMGKNFRDVNFELKWLEINDPMIRNPLIEGTPVLPPSSSSSHFFSVGMMVAMVMTLIEKEIIVEIVHADLVLVIAIAVADLILVNVVQDIPVVVAVVEEIEIEEEIGIETEVVTIRSKKLIL
jgi:hypothetical protein